MPIGKSRREDLVRTALKLFGTRGYHNTGVADILRESGCARGMLYYYFSSKEELGYAAVDEAMRLLLEEAGFQLQTSEHPIDRLLKMIDALPSATKQGAPSPSAIDVAVRMATAHEGFRRRLREGLDMMTEECAKVLRGGVATGQIVDSVDPDQMAHMVTIVSRGLTMAVLLGEREVISEDARRWLKEYLNSLRAKEHVE